MTVKKKQIVKFDNRFNSISIRNVGFKETEYRLLWYMCYKAVDQGSDTIRVSFDELKESGVIRKNCSKNEIKELLNTFYTKLKNFEYISDNFDESGNIKRWMVFYGYETHFEKNEMDFSVTPEAVFFFNELSKGFTVFEYKEMLLLKSNDGINLFRQLKQWRTIGKVRYTLEHVKNFMDIPEDTPTKKVTSLVKKAIEDLKKNLPLTYSDLTVETIKSKRNIIGYLFKFTPERSKELQGKNIVELGNDSTININYDTSSKEIINSYDWKMPYLKELDHPDIKFIEKYKDHVYMDEKSIIGSWNTKIKSEYFENVEVITSEFNNAVFDEKINDYTEIIQNNEGKEKTEEIIKLLKKAINSISDEDKIYKINNCEYRRAHSFVQKTIVVLDDENISNKIGYLKKIIENDL